MAIDMNLIPMYHYENVEEITAESVRSWGAKAVAIDIDNTICYDATSRFIGNSRRWVETLKETGIPVMIVSNAGRRRAMKIAKMLSLECIPLAKKPKHDAFFKAADILGVQVSEIAFVGDQIFSDVKGANEVGAISVYVKPPSKEIVFYFFYRYKRHKEKPIIKYMSELEKASGEKHKVR